MDKAPRLHNVMTKEGTLTQRSSANMTLEQNTKTVETVYKAKGESLEDTAPAQGSIRVSSHFVTSQ